MGKRLFGDAGKGIQDALNERRIPEGLALTMIGPCGLQDRMKYQWDTVQWLTEPARRT